jgi:hypothetical protein
LSFFQFGRFKKLNVTADGTRLPKNHKTKISAVVVFAATLGREVRNGPMNVMAITKWPIALAAEWFRFAL